MDIRKYGLTELRNKGIMETRKYGSGKAVASKTRKYGSKDLRKYGSKDSRKDGMTEVRNYGDTEQRSFNGTLKPLMTEEEKKEAQILELSYDFSCRIIRLYKYLNEGKLSKADRDVIGALGLQLLRAASSINANLNEAQHPQSDADFLSKATIALKESRESETWLSLLKDNGFLELRAAESLLHDCGRINKILITITAKVRKRINGSKD